MSVIVSIADAITTSLEQGRDDGDLGDEYFIPRRSYADWDEELAKLQDLHVDVVAVTNEVTTDLDSRLKVVYVVPVDIGIRKRFKKNEQDPDTREIDKEANDALIQLTEQTLEYFLPQDNLKRPSNQPGRLPGLDCAAWVGAKIRTAGNRIHLRDWRQFTSIVRVTFRATQEISR